MRRRFFTVILGTLVLAAPLTAQKQGQIFLSLTTPDGKAVDGLKADEVVITEDGVECKTAKLEAISWPTKVQLLIDNGRSNTNPINPLRDGLKEFIGLMPEGTEISIYTTAGSPRPVVKPTADKQKAIDGIALIAPDSGSGMFFDSLSEAADRVDKEKTPSFATIVIVGSDFGAMRVLDREYQKLQLNVFNHGITTHVLLNVGGQGAAAGGGQVDLGINIAKMSGGRYESFNGTTRIATLLPEIGKQLAKSIQLQSHQYRITYERPAKPNERAAIAAQIKHDGDVHMSLRGNQ